MSAVLAFLMKVGKGAEYLGAASAVLSVAEAGLERAGYIQPGTKLLTEAAHFVMDAGGVPRRPNGPPQLGAASSAANAPPASSAPPISSSAAASSNNSPAPAAASSAGAPPLGAAPSQRRNVCPACASGKLILAGAGDQIALVLCGNHDQHQAATLERVEGLYIGYANAYGVDLEGGCGKKPDKNSFKNMWGNVEQVQYLEALTNWQQCIAAEKEAKAKAKAKDAKEDATQAKKWAAQDAKEDAKQAKTAAKQTKDAVAAEKAKQKKIASQSLAWQKNRYENQIRDLQAKYAKEQSDATRAALEKQIQDLTQQKLDTEKVANELQQQARDQQHQADLDKMRAEIAAAAQKPGGMDEMFRMMMMARMMAPPAPAPQADPMAAMMMAPVDPVAAMMMAPATMDPLAMDQGLMDFAGHDHDEDDVYDLELASAMGIEGATYGDAERLWNLRENFGQDTSGLFDGIAGDGDGCSIGSCGFN